MLVISYFSVNLSHIRFFHIVKLYMVLKNDIHKYAVKTQVKKNKQTIKRNIDLFKLYSLIITSLWFDNIFNGHLQTFVITVYGIQA